MTNQSNNTGDKKMEKQEFIKNFVADFLEVGKMPKSAIEVEDQIIKQIAGMKTWFRVSGQEQPEWLNITVLLDDILAATQKEIDNFNDR